MKNFNPRIYNIYQAPILTTPNKHITSAFMRTDTSYYGTLERSSLNEVKDKDIHNLKEDDNTSKVHYIYISDKIIIAEEIDNEIKIIVEEDIAEIDTYSFSNFEEYNISLNEELCKDIGYPPYYDNTFYFTNLNYSKTRIYNRLFNILKSNNLKIRNAILIYNDKYNRSELIILIDIFIKLLSIERILLIPHSLSLSIYKNKPNSIIITVFDNYIRLSLIEDYVLTVVKTIYLNNEKNNIDDNNTDNNYINDNNIDNNYIMFKRKYILLDDVDFVEEFKNEDIKKEKIKKCILCNTYDTVEVLSKHLCIKDINSIYNNKESTNKNIETSLESSIKGLDSKSDGSKESSSRSFDSKSDGNKESNIVEIENIIEIEGNIGDSITKYIKENIDPDRSSKMYKNIFILDCCKNNNEDNKNNISEELLDYFKNKKEVNVDMIMDDCFIGAMYLNSIENSKELWLSFCEWNSGRIRVLKEKILFSL